MGARTLWDLPSARGVLPVRLRRQRGLLALGELAARRAGLCIARVGGGGAVRVHGVHLGGPARAARPCPEAPLRSQLWRGRGGVRGASARAPIQRRGGDKRLTFCSSEP